VEKYENEQKTLLEELTLAHSKLVELKLTISELEKQKESLRQDCNLAVSLLQCRQPNESCNTNNTSHSYHTLPLSIKTRLKSNLNEEEARHLENLEQEKIDKQNQLERNASHATFNLPIFQPTVAAAMMSMNHQQQNQTKSRLKKIESDDFYTSISMNNDVNLDDGTVSVRLLADMLKKETSSAEHSRKSLKFFPYVCLRCKKEVSLCDSPSQTDEELYSKHHTSCLTKSNTVGNNLSEIRTSNLTLRGNTHQKCASIDLNKTYNTTNSSLNGNSGLELNINYRCSNSEVNKIREESKSTTNYDSKSGPGLSSIWNDSSVQHI
jgi:hypothetical protein